MRYRYDLPRRCHGGATLPIAEALISAMEENPPMPSYEHRIVFTMCQVGCTHVTAYGWEKLKAILCKHFGISPDSDMECVHYSETLKRQL